jgi:uncharacterized protein YjiS (DUF1127 family)
MQTVLGTPRPWVARLLDAIVDRWRDRQRRTALHDLDRRTLADIGIDASEISSIAAEAGLRARRTRLRIVALDHRG